MADKLRVLIADDHTIVRAGVRLLLEAERDMEVVGEALNGEEAVTLAESLRPDVILMDIAMPGAGGLEATRQIKARIPEVAVVVLTMHRSDEYFFEMLKAGASGYVLKGAETNELVSAIRTVGRGEVFLYPSMAKHLLQDYLSRLGVSGSAAGPSLTPREREILRLMADGYSNKEIAEQLVVSPSTVHSHRSNLMRKLNLNSRHALIQYARERGLLRG
ncbi:MAG TPA: response regulator transcription factor [Anaerolineales bacterium]|nr:response regulator transcription factor [Anaerolineales bacterium]